MRGLLAQRVHPELSGAATAERAVSGLDGAIRESLDADLPDSVREKFLVGEKTMSTKSQWLFFVVSGLWLAGNAQADVIAVGSAGFPAGSTVLDFAGLADGTEVNGLTLAGVQFGYTNRRITPERSGPNRSGAGNHEPHHGS